jgi:uncharacterized protein (DUF1330 family)
MTVYAVVGRTINYREEYQKYLDGLTGVLKCGRRWVVSDESVRVIEGPWENEEFTLLSFPDEVAFSWWTESPELRELAKHRHHLKAGASSPKVAIPNSELLRR